MYTENDFRAYELYHHGILGQKWGVRRYQNADGTLTAAGRKRLGRAEKVVDAVKKTAKILKDSSKPVDGDGWTNKIEHPNTWTNDLPKPGTVKDMLVEKKKDTRPNSWTTPSKSPNQKTDEWLRSQNEKAKKEIKDAVTNKIKEKLPENKLTDQQKKALKIGAAAVGGALAVYGAYKLSQTEAYQKAVDINKIMRSSTPKEDAANIFLNNNRKDINNRIRKYSSDSDKLSSDLHGTVDDIKKLRGQMQTQFTPENRAKMKQLFDDFNKTLEKMDVNSKEPEGILKDIANNTIAQNRLNSYVRDRKLKQIKTL